MQYILLFENPLASKSANAGGKGANLATLSQSGFPVPPGFIISIQAYRDFIVPAASLLEAVRSWPVHEHSRVRALAEQLQARLSEFPLPPSLTGEVAERLKQFPNDAAFAVRSSSNFEDLAQAAFAGQHESYLNCSGLDRILARIRDCFVSMWSDRAILYRQDQGFDHAQAAMAVVVQRLVNCDKAGVGFTINPVTGDLTEMLVNSNYGLGESVVSGEVPVDQIVIRRSDGAVLRSSIASKSSMTVPCPEGAVAPAAVPAARASEPVLDADEIVRLAELMLRVEEFSRFPQDIEWGFAQQELVLFQSRPITTIPARWTRDESAERFPNVITPLTWDFVESGFHKSLNFSFRLMGYPPFNGKWFGKHDHYIYGNQNAVELYGRRAPFRIRSIDELRERLPHIRSEFRWVQELPGLWSRDLDFYLIKLGEFMAEPLDSKSLAELWQYILDVKDHGAQYFLPNIAISITQTTLHRVLHALLKLVVGPDGANSLFDNLLAYSETKTGLINRELLELAALVNADPALAFLIRHNVSRSLIESGLLSAFLKFHERFHKFLRDHGHREVDFDAYSPTWIEAPWLVLDNLRLLLDTPEARTAAAKERELRIRMQSAELDLFLRIPADLHFFFSELVRLARLYTALDDLEHYQTTRLTLPLRRGLRELGLRLVQRGALLDPMDIFFARQSSIDRALAADSTDSWAQFRSDILAEKASYTAASQRQPAWNLDATAATRPPKPLSGRSIQGLAGSPGQAEGPAFLVLCPEDFAHFPKGAVLIARTTNPTWTPLFYSATAVVTESGGPLSHGAVTAREIGIPAVLSAPDILQIQNGQPLRVDGTLGTVTFLDSPPQS